MSYAAAIELDMTGAGTAMVEVEALTRGKAVSQPVYQPAPAPTTAPPAAQEEFGNMYVQVGAFGESVNAERLVQKLNNEGIAKAAVYEPNGEQPALYRVRIGPVSTVSEFDQIVRRVEDLAIAETQLVIEPAPASGT